MPGSGNREADDLCQAVWPTARQNGPNSARRTGTTTSTPAPGRLRAGFSHASCTSSGGAAAPTGQVNVIARSGQLLAASRALASSSTGTSGVVTWEWPSSFKANTSGQNYQQRA